MDSNTLLLLVSMALFVGFVANHLFAKYRAPDVLFLILFGVLLGPGITGMIDGGMASQITQFTTYVAAVALSVIMLQAGMDLKIKDVVKSFNRALIFTLIAFFVSTGVIALVCKLTMNWSLGESLLMGVILAGTSGAIVIPLIKALNVSTEVKTMLTLEAALTDVLVIGGAMAIMAVMASGNADLVAVGTDVFIAFLVSSILGVVGGIIWLRVLKHIGQNLSYMVTLAFMLLLFSLAELTVGL
ncbi:MAG TPA: cation:proton antiporter, partial [Methanomassiliicoccaceae archaeon]|nr:cation:proton antiporter [Methanomassiliicoccaceae archaeon]